MDLKQGVDAVYWGSNSNSSSSSSVGRVVEFVSDLWTVSDLINIIFGK